MPYFAPDAAIPITSCAPRFAEINANPHTHAGIARPARKKSELVFTFRRSSTPIPITNTKYTSMMIQSIAVRFVIFSPGVGVTFRQNPSDHTRTSAPGEAQLKASPPQQMPALQILAIYSAAVCMQRQVLSPRQRTKRRDVPSFSGAENTARKSISPSKYSTVFGAPIPRMLLPRRPHHVHSRSADLRWIFHLHQPSLAPVIHNR